MPAPKKSWTQKLHAAKDLPKVEKIEGKLSKRWGTGTVAIPSPLEVNNLMRRVPKGKVTTINNIRAAVAKKHHATMGCPITSGIFAWVAVHAADEQRRQGKKNVTPYWRTLKTGGELNEKYPGGIANQSKLLKKEKQKIIKQGKYVLVADYEKKLARL